MEKNISGLYLWCKGPFNISRKKLVIFRWWCAVKNIYVLLLIFRVFAQLLKEYISYNIKLYEKPKLGFISNYSLFFSSNECPGLFGAFYLIINSELWRGVLILLITYRNIQERTIHNITIESSLKRNRNIILFFPQTNKKQKIFNSDGSGVQNWEMVEHTIRISVRFDN